MCVCVKREIMKTTVSKTNSQIKAVVLAVTGIYQHTAKSLLLSKVHKWEI